MIMYSLKTFLLDYSFSLFFPLFQVPLGNPDEPRAKVHCVVKYTVYGVELYKSYLFSEAESIKKEALSLDFFSFSPFFVHTCAYCRR